MIPKTNCANLAHQPVILAKLIKINALNVLVGRIEFYLVNNAFANYHIMMLTMKFVRSVALYV